MFSVCFDLLLRDSVKHLRLSMYTSPLVMLSCIYFLVVFVVCMFTVLMALFVCMVVLDTLYLSSGYPTRANSHLLKSFSS